MDDSGNTAALGQVAVIIAALSFAYIWGQRCGVLPPGLVHSALAAIVSIISLAFIGALAEAKTCAAASIADSFLSLGALVFFAVAFFVALAVFVVFDLDIVHPLHFV